MQSAAAAVRVAASHDLTARSQCSASTRRDLLTARLPGRSNLARRPQLPMLAADDFGSAMRAARLSSSTRPTTRSLHSSMSSHLIHRFNRELGLNLILSDRPLAEIMADVDHQPTTIRIMMQMTASVAQFDRFARVWSEVFFYLSSLM